MSSFDQHHHNYPLYEEDCEKMGQYETGISTVFVQNEVVTSKTNLRYRNRSHDSIGTMDGSVHTSLEGSPPLGFSTPVAHSELNITSPTPQKISRLSFDELKTHTDLNDTSGFYGSPTIRITNAEVASKAREEKAEDLSPFEILNKSFRRRISLYDTDERVKIRQLLPIIVVAILLASYVFTIFFFQGSLSRKYSADGELLPTNGKYQSMEFAVKRMVEKGRIMGDIVSEDGTILRGKRAAMQFAYNKKHGISSVGSEAEQEKKELDLLLQEVEKIQKGDSPAKSRQELLNKLAKFGHFSSSVVRSDPSKPEQQKTLTESPNEVTVDPGVQAKVQELEQPQPSKRSQRSPSQSKLRSPFRFSSDDEPVVPVFGPLEEDDPFRFV